ncbi:hypothetical protein [Shewanella youngdeokensis]|uniref:Chemotaxis protein n=1 Tax=Shewanella youngdeokensis TaxID=2999068 RepID=A0ABZ0K3S0_9GAMM|nr:hypothetical protein RGE70_06645 [Shewanella sp. DAU334]
MFTNRVLLEKFRLTVIRVIFLFGCIVLLVFHSPVHADDGDVRTELLKALELQLKVTNSLGRTDLSSSLESAIQAVHLASDAELNQDEGIIEGIKNYGDSLQKLETSIQAASEVADTQSFEAQSSYTSSEYLQESITPPAYFDGGSTGTQCTLFADATKGERNNSDLVLDAQIALGVAKVAWAGVEVACGLDVVQIGTVGVSFAVCEVAALLVASSEEIVNGFLRCDETVDEAHLDAAFIRAEDNFNLGTNIHDDLVDHDININANLVEHDLNISSQLDLHDHEIKGLILRVIANQREIIKLLKTPQGKRPDWNQGGKEGKEDKGNQRK